MYFCFFGHGNAVLNVVERFRVINKQFTDLEGAAQKVATPTPTPSGIFWSFSSNG